MLKPHRWYDWMYQEAMLERIERATFVGAVTGFVLHLLLIALQNTFHWTWPPMTLINGNYLSAIYTPFSFILFYEVLMLVYYIPSSITKSIAKQFEIVSLIVIRRVFKDIAQFEKTEIWAWNNPYIQGIFLDMASALLMFLMIAAFYNLRKKCSKLQQKKRTKSEMEKKKLQRFINTKKTFAVLLTLVLLGLSFVSFYQWLADILAYAPPHSVSIRDVNKVFYQDFFMLMALFDVMVLLFSFIYTKGYAQTFRNAGFVCSTVLIRIAFSAPQFYNILFLLCAIAFGVIVLGLYYLFNLWQPCTEKTLPQEHSSQQA